MSISLNSLEDMQAPSSWPTVDSTATTPSPLGTFALSVALVSPTDSSRRAIAATLTSLGCTVTRGCAFYPAIDSLPRLLEERHDVILVELDSDPERALEVVENICANSSITAMVYSEKASADMVVRCMRAGAREFLIQPITAEAISAAFIRSSARRPAASPLKQRLGKLLIFAGAKGGSGVTTAASNFAVSLAHDSGSSTILIDLNMPFGNAALDLGLTPRYCAADALNNFARLDSNYLATLLTKHSSGLSVLAAADKFAAVPALEGAVEKLLSVARQQFDYVVIDAGSRFDSHTKSLFEAGATVYLVLQVGVSELRNAHRLVSEFFKPLNVNLEIVLNRFSPRTLSIDERSIEKALTVPAKWKIRFAGSSTV